MNWKGHGTVKRDLPRGSSTLGYGFQMVHENIHVEIQDDFSIADAHSSNQIPERPRGRCLPVLLPFANHK